jgi:hypothetical protein
LTSLAKGLPVGVVAAGDSLWFLNPANPESLYQRPSIPLDVEVHDLAFQVNVRPPLYFHDARLLGATPQGLFIWTPVSETLHWNDLGHVEAVEASHEWVALLTRDDGKGRLRLAQTTRTEDMVDPQTWTVEWDDVPEVHELRLDNLPLTWFQEMAPEEKTWKEIEDETSLPVGILCPREKEGIHVLTPSPYHASVPLGFASSTSNEKTAPVNFRKVAPLRKVVAILEMDSQDMLQVRYLGDGHTGETIWRSEKPFRALNGVGTPPQGGLGTWTVASHNSLLLLQVPVPRLIRMHGEEVQVRDSRKLEGTLADICTDDTRWIALAYEDGDGQTTVEVMDGLSWSLTPVATCQIRGKVRALATIPLESMKE